MTDDRLTDEQVREFSARAKAARIRREQERAWVEAQRRLGFVVPPMGKNWEATRDEARRICAERGISVNYPGNHDQPNWEELELLLAEVRRARGME